MLLLLVVVPMERLYAAGQQLYRYTNHDGVIVIDDSIPSEFVGKGYEIMNRRGVVVRVVPPELTPEQRAAVEEAVSARELERKARERDRSLLLRYSSIKDIEIARDRALKDVQIRISILESNQYTLKQSLSGYQSEAADAERRGEKVEPTLLKEIDNLQRELTGNEDRIALRQKQMEDVARQYAADISRFQELADLVQLRQQRERGELD
ncbi:MAG: hypothetical protein ACK5HY_14230 [Parahaliea sp.]